MKFCNIQCSCFNVPLAVKALCLLVTAVWVITLFDVIMESSSGVISLTAAGAVLSLVTNSYIFLTANDNSNFLVK